MLSPEEFAELVAIIQTNHDDGPKPEVRRAQRISHECRVSITFGSSEDSGPLRLVEIKDISARGLSFMHDQNLPSGTTFVIKLEAPAGNSVSILSNVVHCRPIDEHSFQIGAEFTCALGNKPEPAREYAPEDLMRIRSSILH